ncbi:MAG: serine/threonine protein kinase, partial [Myxococcales bacterium]|nr:serine/threonine protein kinase [Myxococcales bacterium]
MDISSQFGPYRIVGRIGVGGMAEVYEARDADGDRVALKVLLPGLRDNAEIVDMFIDEASITTELDHPNIVSVRDFGSLDGVHFMAMEFVDGWDLGRLLDRCRAAARPLSAHVAAYVGSELSHALEHVHLSERQIVHRDVTPHNVFVRSDGAIKLADFGIARAAARRTRTTEGQLKGKLAYLAPEQATGEAITARTDIYAVGLLLFEIATGRPLLSAESDVELIQQAIDPPRISPSSIYAAAAPLDAVVARALQPHPVMRYASAMALASALDGLHERASAAAELAGVARELFGGRSARSRQAADHAPAARARTLAMS